MIARISHTFEQVAAAIFPFPGCTVRGYSFAKGTRYNITIGTPGLGLPAEYHAIGTTCHQALAAAVQLFHDTAHAYPGAMAYAPQ
ncbi:hypothetical protein [Hymenobacter siberiensis]|uniref:hypothetical protein n=1 Tax=Hymenobacter siberiensis TaxID=2848396 RepID=UPI001C1E4916|nr:hypothetical protein [Hymenobacter siberiensis]MBU6122252.1 hypothetical protein [Hymenobacter siberiensis]